MDKHNSSNHYLITRESYNKVAAEYADKHSNPSNIIRLMEPFIREIPYHGTILDAGCGPGRDASVFIEKGFNVVGLDFSQEMVRLAKSVHKLEVNLGDVRDLDFGNCTFDAVWANASLHHLDKDDLYLSISEFERVLKNDGVLFIAVKKGSMKNFDKEYPMCPRFYKKYELDEIKSALKSSNLTIYKTEVAKRNNNRDSSWLFVYAIKKPNTQLQLNFGSSRFDFGCRFCSIVSNCESDGTSDRQVDHDNEDVSLANEQLYESSHFLVFPGLGHLVEGYTVIVYKDHISSMGYLTESQLKELDRVKSRISTIFEPEFGSMMFFEHGEAKGGMASGSSIIHAHMHCVPYSSTFVENTIKALPFKDMKSFPFMKEAALMDKSYLLIEYGDKSLGCLIDHGLPSQFLRRQLARSIGEGFHWNWRYYPFDERVERTIMRLEDRYGRHQFE
jgi:SAM-dependent methyltransferase/diadenosine tetraphosphate (Ap4A) HIT family hydrolase